MKVYISILLALLLVIGCGESTESEETAAGEDDVCPSLVGTWELLGIDEGAAALSGEFESDPDYEEAPTLKVLNETHWMFIRQTADRFVHAQGGRYSLEPGGFYTEYVHYSAIPQNVGQSFNFQCELEGDSIWHHIGGQGDARYDETWRRVN